MDEEEKPKSWGVVCAAKDCTVRKAKKEDGGISFHYFPMKNQELCKSWAKESKAEFNPTKHDMLCGTHFRDEDYKSPKRRYLKDDAVPTLFTWSRKTPVNRSAKADEKPPAEKRDRSPSKDELKAQVDEQKKKIKSLQQKVRREKKKNKSLSDIIDDMKSQGLLNSDTSAILKESFSGLSSEIIMNHFKNKDKSTQGHRYSEEVKQFALTVHFYSPRAYQYLRPILSLPHPRSLCAIIPLDLMDVNWML